MLKNLLLVVGAAALLGGCSRNSADAQTDKGNFTRPVANAESRCGDDPLVLDCVRSPEGDVVPTLINGQELDLAKWKYVVRITVGSSGCTATVVGPKVALTAAHCGATGAAASFKIGTKSFTGKIERSSLYPGVDHDVSVIILDQEVAKADVDVFAIVGGTATNGTEYFLAGYGCTQAGGGGGNDGKLRGGKARMTGTSGFDMVTGGRGQAALCFGDSGGPLFVGEDNTKPTILSINSKGNIRDTNYNSRLDVQESKSFLTAMGTKYSVKICGINGDEATCGGENPPPPPPPPPPGCDDTTRKVTLLKIAECFEIPIAIPTFQ